jgi:hypothetical protein
LTNGIPCLSNQSSDGKCVIRACPCFFNLVHIAANGLALPFENAHTGLYGPVILIPKDDYEASGGHAAVKNSVTEDLALGETLRRRGIPYALRNGGQDVSFRMYGQGLKPLLEGWSKNFATGALKKNKTNGSPAVGSVFLFGFRPAFGPVSPDPASFFFLPLSARTFFPGFSAAL